MLYIAVRLGVLLAKKRDEVQFYAQGVKANVLFFDRRQAGEKPQRTEHLRIYELRTAKRYSLKTNPLQREDLDEFLKLYKSGKARRDAAGKVTAGGSSSLSYRIQEILATEECLWDLAVTEDDGSARQPGLARLDELSRLVADDLRHALALINGSAQ
ncbi:N-6 DNA methylase [Paucibacter sp. hw1]|uniref:N-6 DNA methylase n=1 Tax=Roseateles koreensis TaxID=2987526 RepID=A0ABT5KRN9_9BURK|nr:N-6 DNA methylase [Roseateles koreensis]MDC8785597.1 N-6 DNA methylase [Roseateles koreensis]